MEAATAIPVGLWVTLTAVFTLLTFWPPLPPERKNCVSKSCGLILTSWSFISGRIATVAVEVWILPRFSVLGIRWTLWTPDSFFKMPNTFGPLILSDRSSS